MGKHAKQKIITLSKISVLALTGVLAATTGGSIAAADSGVDISSYQGKINAGQAKAAGVNWVMQKITEGTGWTDSTAQTNLANAKAAGIRRAVYHFADVSGHTPEAEADHFIARSRQLGIIGDGVIPVLDWEPSGNLKKEVWWAKAWLDRVAAALGTKPLIYMSASTIKLADWSPVASANYGLFVAGYPRGYASDGIRNPGSVPYSVSPWAFAAAWQYSSSGHVAGIGGTSVDVDWFYGDAGTWAKYANSPVGSTTNTVTTVVSKSATPTGDASTLATAVIQGLYGNGQARRNALGSRYSEVMAVVNQRLRGSSTGRPYTVQRGDYLARIGAKTGVSWRTIASLNGIRSPYRIYPGQVLKLTGSTSTTTHTYHVIKSGETLSSIARAYGTTVSRLAALNGITNINRIYAGHTLRIR